MQPVKFVPGKLKLKGKGKKKSLSAKEEEEEEKIKKEFRIREYNHPDHVELKQINPTSIQHDPKAIVDQLTPAEVRAMAIKNKAVKRILDVSNSVSYSEQKEKFNEKMKSYPMHNDLEGD